MARMTRAPARLPDGQISEVCFQGVCPVPSRKIFRFAFDPNHLLNLRHPVPREGTLAIVTDVGAGSGGRESCD